MEFFKQHFKRINKKVIIITVFFIIIGGFLIGISYAKAAWETPTSQPPDSNIFAPLDVSPNRQAKEGNLLLDPLYNPYGLAPTVNYPLEVRGPNDVYINNFEVISEGNLIVDLDTLYVDGTNNQVGIGTLTPTSGTKLDISGGSFNIGQSGNGVAGIGLNVSSTSNEEVVYGLSTGVNQASIYGLGIGNSIGVYGNNISSGSGIYAVSDNSSAVVGSTAKEYSTIGNKVAGIYASAKGLGAWAGYFSQRLFGSSEIVGSKFLPNRLQNSQIPYTAGWKSKSVNDSELIDVSLMTFDGQYIWAIGGGWGEETVMQINPDTMGILDKIVLGANGEHGFTDIIDGGGYIWAAHWHNFGDFQSAVTRIDPSNNNSYITFQIYPSIYPIVDQNTFAVKLLYDDQTADGPYLWILNRLDSGAMHSITQMRMDGTIVRTFSIDALANGGNKCSRLAMYGSTNQCTDQLDNNMNGTIDNGLCTYTATDLATCTTAGGTWVEGCTDKTFTNATDCTAGGATWATTCSNNAYTTLNECNNCTGGIWDSVTNTCTGDADCISQTTCNGTGGGIWVAGDAQCIAGAPLGVCDNGIDTTWGECITAGANWTWNTSTTDERIVDAYLGGPSGMTLDGSGNIWLSFFGAPGWGVNGYGGEGYAKFDAADPLNSAKQYVYCSGPETRPADIDYDSINNQMWLPYATTYGNDNRGIAKVNAINGQVSEFLWHYFGNTGDPENQLKYFSGTPGGPSVWIKSFGVLHKLNPDTNAVEHDYNAPGYGMDLYDFDFDTRDVNNPVIWQLTGASGVILKHTMDNPPGYQTTSSLIKGSQVESMIFDGTNIWAANYASTIISKYSAQGGVKIADYDIGVDPRLMIFDGQAIWISYYDAGSKFKKINVNSGNISEYSIDNATGINTYYTQDIVYDGQNVWLAKSLNNTKQLIKVDLSNCDSTTKICTTGSYYDLSDNPIRLLFDGEYIWVFYHNKNNISKFSLNPITLEADITISEISNSLSVPNNYQRISATEFDGTYIWVGAYNVDGEGNSIYKINPKGKNYTDSFVGICSNDSSISCNLNSDCGGNTCNAVVADKYPVFHMSGSCSVSGNSCAKDSDCGGTETCNNMYANVSTLTFDGTNMWATHQGYGNHNDVGNECNDNLDNDGNGLCDADGASGYAGCSGKPDPSCLLSTDSPEMSGGSGLYDSNRVLTRIIAATGEIVESVPVRSNDSYYDVNDAIFDGQNIWLGGRDFDNNSLVSFYSGSGSGLTNLDSSITLYGSMPISSQSGAFSISGSANFGNNLIVANDFVALGNLWGPAENIFLSSWVNTGQLTDVVDAILAYSIIGASNGDIFAGTYPSGNVYRSSDSGTTWSNTSDLIGATYVYSLMQASNGDIFAGTHPNCDIFRSSDSGTTWSQLSLGATCAVYSLMQASNGDIFAGTTGGNIYRSTDGGNNWTNINLPGVATVRSIIEANNGYYYAGTDSNGDVFVSIDAGVSWTNTSNITYGGTDATHIYSLLKADENGTDVIYAGTLPNGYVYRTTDNGTTWTKTSGDLVGASAVRSLIQSSNGDIYAGTNAGADVYKTTDFGNTWSAIAGITGTDSWGLAEATNGDLFAATGLSGDVFRLQSVPGVDNLRVYGLGCDNGQFTKGIDNNSREVSCRPL